jgi:hypothetical protein
LVTGTESYLDLQTYGAYNKVTELEIRTIRVVSRPYNQFEPKSVRPQRLHGTEATDRVTGAVQQQFSTDLNTALFASWPTSWAGPAE